MLDLVFFYLLVNGYLVINQSPVKVNFFGIVIQTPHFIAFKDKQNFIQACFGFNRFCSRGEIEPLLDCCGLIVYYYGARKIRKYQLKNLEFLIDLLSRLCNTHYGFKNRWLSHQA